MTARASKGGWIAGSLSALLLWISCSGVGPFDTTRQGALPDGISLSPAQLVLGSIGGQRRLSLTDGDGDPIAPGSDVAWRSSDPAVATVGPDGTVTAVADGTATITAELESMSSTTQVTVAATLELVVQVSALDQGDPDTADNRVVTTISVQAR